MYKKFGLFLAVGMLTVLAACGSSQLVKENTKVTFSYQGLGDFTHVAGQQTIIFDSPNSELYLALEGMKKGDTKVISYTDIENRHNEDLIYQYPLGLLQEMGFPTSAGSQFEVSDELVTISGIKSEEGIEKAILDRNPLETIFPIEYQITILSLRSI